MQVLLDVILSTNINSLFSPTYYRAAIQKLDFLKTIHAYNNESSKKKLHANLETFEYAFTNKIDTFSA